MQQASKLMGVTQEQGQLAETLACQHLEKQGLKLLERNYHCRYGELDLIMQDKDSVVFVEVRYRNNPNFGSGAESITAKKQSKLVKSAAAYLQQHAKLAKYAARFDVISMSGILHADIKNKDTSQFNIEWIENAFDA